MTFIHSAEQPTPTDESEPCPSCGGYGECLAPWNRDPAPCPVCSGSGLSDESRDYEEDEG